jgi:hypothetical protein
VAGRDITEGRSSRAIAVDVGVVSDTSIWQNTDIAYDVAIGGMPFIYAISDQHPYVRQTAPYRKEQYDNQTEPGEQSLTGWWLRSQSSFHDGTGITFYDPALIPGEGTFQFADSKGVDIWTEGQVTLLKRVNENHITTGPIATNGRPQQFARPIQWTSSGTTYNAILLHDEYDVDKVALDGTVTHFIDYNSGTDDKVYGLCDDGTTAYWVTNVTSGGATKLTVYKKALTGDSSTANTKMFDVTGKTVSNAIMEFVKERIVACFNNEVYEFTGSASSLPTVLYTHPSANHNYTSITASGTAIYLSGYNGIQSTIQKFTLSTSGAMPTLSQAVVAAELPVGEIVFKIYYYLGKMAIGTSKGIRIATVESDGSITYGPLIVETSQPCYDFTARDHYIWCATGVDGNPGLIRINLGNELSNLIFAYANDVYYSGVTGHRTTACAFFGTTDQVGFATAYASSANGHVYREDPTVLNTSGYITTGYIRYNTLEPKNFKRLLGRGEFTYGSMTMETVDEDGVEYDIVSYDSSVAPVEVTTSQPAGSREYLAYKFILYRDGTDNTKGPTFKGYQAKATIATPRQRVIKFPVFCYDVETDKYNVQVGYLGRALNRVQQLETIEQNGDVVTWQDLQTGESRQVIIEQVTFTRLTPPDRGFSGYGGILEILIRTV